MTLATDATRILVVDDSALYRQSIQNVLREIDAVEVVGWAKDGVEALAKIEQLNPDLLTLDVQMPDMDGIQVFAGSQTPKTAGEGHHGQQPDRDRRAGNHRRAAGGRV